MSENNAMYQINGIDKSTWRKFRGKCLLSGFRSANECFIKIIDLYVSGKINVKK